MFKTCSIALISLSAFAIVLCGQSGTTAKPESSLYWTEWRVETAKGNATVLSMRRNGKGLATTLRIFVETPANGKLMVTSALGDDLQLGQRLEDFNSGWTLTSKSVPSLLTKKKPATFEEMAAAQESGALVYDQVLETSDGLDLRWSLSEKNGLQADRAQSVLHRELGNAIRERGSDSWPPVPASVVEEVRFLRAVANGNCCEGLSSSMQELGDLLTAAQDLIDSLGTSDNSALQLYSNSSSWKLERVGWSQVVRGVHYGSGKDDAALRDRFGDGLAGDPFKGVDKLLKEADH